jgi:Trypsin
MTTMGVWFVVFLTAFNSWAQDEKNCQASKDDLYRLFKESQGRYPMMKESCFEGLRDDLDTFEDIYLSCAISHATQGDVRAPNPSADSRRAGGIVDTQDKLIQELVAQANCHFLYSSSLNDKVIHGSGMKACESGSNSGVPMESEHTALYAKAVKEELKKRDFCVLKAGHSFEGEARSALSASEPSRSQAELGGQIICLSKSRVRRCAYYPKGSGSMRELDPSNPEDQKKLAKAGVSHLSDVNKTTCSGALLADGATVVTAAHCLDAGHRKDLSFVDAEGRLQRAEATCSAASDWTSSGKDFATCRLARPTARSNNLMLVRNNGVPGGGCQTQGAEYHCTDRALQKMTQRPVRLYGADADGTDQGRVGFLQSEGYAFFDKNGRVTHSAPTQPGFSGTPIIMEMEGGKRVIVGIHGSGAPIGVGGIGYTPSVESLRAARRGLSPQSIFDGIDLFQELQEAVQ